MKRITGFAQQHRVSLGIIMMLFAVVIAIVYLVVVPEQAVSFSGIAQIILLYAHSLCWVLLAIGALLFALNIRTMYIAITAYAALAVYVIFVITFMLTA